MQVQQFFGNDLPLTSGGISPMSSGDELSQESVIRRLLTNPGDYIWHPDYGAGIGKFVGQNLSASNFDHIKNTLISQMFLESSVAQFPRPEINISIINGTTLQCDIVYYSAVTRNAVPITFQVS